ncbi:cytochrome b561 [Sphingomonas jejuensis]|uniref:Cytochrome b561 n=1 Tax=Sphingomonas jejuensis TaxID=904715 RepID=A0ABX0XMZ1_9SPHN|nr:cytochrome b [Sphingomonas jejuensis]NJC34112.1 cytochrome b561 [Sphingomonas jejuensis]
MAALRNKTERYNMVAVVLHWLIAALLLWQIWLGFNRSEGNAFDWHKTIGILILVLSVARLVWRLVNPPPSLSGEVAGWERFAAGLNHALFYVVLIGLPLTGWAAVSTGRAAREGATSTSMVGGLDLPLLPLGQGLHDPAESAHVLMVWMTFVLLAIHVAAALKHQFVDRTAAANRMPPFGVRNPR